MSDKMQRVRQVLRNAKGFTLIELMGVLAILAIILLIAVPAIGSIIEKANASADDSSIDLIENAAEKAYIDDKIAFDGPEPDSYTVPHLIEQGYLNLDSDHKFNQPENYVVKKNDGGEFIWMGDGSEGIGVGDNTELEDIAGLPNPIDTLSCSDAETAGYTCIYTPGELNDIRNGLSGKYILMNDIDLVEFANWTPIGLWNAPFTGELNGNGFSIDNMVLGALPLDATERGLFGVMAYGTIENLLIRDAELDGSNGGSNRSLRRSSFLIGDVTSNSSLNNTLNPLTISNVAVTGSAREQVRFGTIIGEARANNRINISNIHVDVETAATITTAAGIIQYYEPVRNNTATTASMFVKDVVVNGTLDSGRYSSGIVDSVYASYVKDGIVFEGITVNADIISGRHASGFAYGLDLMSSSAEEFTMRDITVNGDISGVRETNATAHGFANYMTSRASRQLEIANIFVNGDIKAPQDATGFIGVISYANGLATATNNIQNINIDSIVTSNKVGMFTKKFSIASSPSFNIVQDVTIQGEARMSGEFATFLDIDVQSSRGVGMERFDIDIIAARGDDQNAQYTSGSSVFSNYLYSRNNTGNITMREMDVNVKMLTDDRAFGFIGEIDHRHTAALTGRLVLEDIGLSGSIESRNSDVSGFVEYIGGETRNDSGTVTTRGGAVDIRNLAIDYTLTANNGVVFAPITDDDFRSYYTMSVVAGWSSNRLLGDSSTSVLENIQAIYDLSNHTGAANAAQFY